MINPYQDIAKLYLAIVPPKDTLGNDISDSTMSHWLTKNLPNNFAILKAGCGLGFDMIALHRGLPSQNTKKKWNVYGSDYSQDMLNEAMKYGANYGIAKTHYKESSFAGLIGVEEWENKFDCVLINYAIYTYPDFVKNYEEYFLDCIEGISYVLKDKGYFIFNVRSWNNKENILSYKNTHDGVTYYCDYHWYYGENREHQAKMKLSDSNGLKKEILLHFAQRTAEEYKNLLEQIGYQVILIESLDEDFITIICEKKN